MLDANAATEVGLLEEEGWMPLLGSIMLGGCRLHFGCDFDHSLRKQMIALNDFDFHLR